MFQDIVTAKVIEREICGIWRRIGSNGVPKQKFAETLIDIQSCIQGIDRVFFSDVFAAVW
jgi:hypothetical protein